jgi:hypothetical protein
VAPTLANYCSVMNLVASVTPRAVCLHSLMVVTSFQSALTERAGETKDIGSFPHLRLCNQLSKDAGKRLALTY